MFRRPLTAGHIGLTLILVGVCTALGAVWWDNTRIWIPLDVPLSLTRGHFRSPEFAINVEGRYEVSLLVDRIGDDKTAQCLLVGDYDCTTPPHAVRVAWILSKNSVQISHGENTGGTGWGNTDGTLDRNLGPAFAPSKGRYTLNLDILEDASVLDARHPRLFIQEDDPRFGDYESDWSSLFLLGMLPFVFGMFLLALSVVQFFSRKLRHSLPSLTAPGLYPGALHSVGNNPESYGETQKKQTKSSASVWLGAFLSVAGVVASLFIRNWIRSRTWEPFDDHQVYTLALQYLTALLIPAGVSVAIFGLLLRSRARCKFEIALTPYASVGQNFQWARKSVLREPFPATPSFALVAVLVLMLMWAVMVMIVASLHDAHVSRGFYVRLTVTSPLKTPVSAPPVNTLKPMAIRVVDAGPSVVPALYLNADKIRWEDLGKIMQRQIANPVGQTVFIGS